MSIGWGWVQRFIVPWEAEHSIAVIGQFGFLLTTDRLYVRFLHTDKDSRRRDRKR